MRQMITIIKKYNLPKDISKKITEEEIDYHLFKDLIEPFYLKDIDYSDSTSKLISKLLRKLIFDVSVKTKLKSINIDGEIIQATDEMMKVEIKESKVQKVNLELTYTINIVNEGEVEATVEELLDQLPSGLRLKNDNLDWKVNNENKATYNRKRI